MNGRLPVSGPMASPQGPLSDPNETFAGCEGFFPAPAELPAIYLQHLQSSLTGGPSSLFEGRCSGRSLGDGLARGFVTLDVVRSCEVLFPSDPGYFGAEGVVGYDNVLWGDYFTVDVANDLAYGESLVRIHAKEGGLDNGLPDLLRTLRRLRRQRRPGASAAPVGDPLCTGRYCRHLHPADRLARPGRGAGAVPLRHATGVVSATSADPYLLRRAGRRGRSPVSEPPASPRPATVRACSAPPPVPRWSEISRYRWTHDFGWMLFDFHFNLSSPGAWVSTTSSARVVSASGSTQLRSAMHFARRLPSLPQ